MYINLSYTQSILPRPPFHAISTSIIQFQLQPQPHAHSQATTPAINPTNPPNADGIAAAAPVTMLMLSELAVADALFAELVATVCRLEAAAPVATLAAPAGCVDLADETEAGAEAAAVLPAGPAAAFEVGAALDPADAAAEAAGAAEPTEPADPAGDPAPDAAGAAAPGELALAPAPPADAAGAEAGAWAWPWD